MTERTPSRKAERLEPGSVHTSYVLIGAAGFLILLFGAISVFAVIYQSAVPNPQPAAPRAFPAPQLEAHPAAELHRLLARQHKELNSYRWANADHTLIAIPIQQAMKLIAQRGDQALAPIPSVSGAPRSPPGAKP
jgi:hypothetical protein